MDCLIETRGVRVVKLLSSDSHFFIYYRNFKYSFNTSFRKQNVFEYILIIKGFRRILSTINLGENVQFNLRPFKTDLSG